MAKKRKAKKSENQTQANGEEKQAEKKRGQPVKSMFLRLLFQTKH